MNLPIRDPSEHSHAEEFDSLVKEYLDSADSFDVDEIGGIVVGYLSELPVIHRETLEEMIGILIKNGFKRPLAIQIMITALEAVKESH